jgi:hypothetical protein
MGDIHSDDGMTPHGSKAEPILVPVRSDYLDWEYRQMGDTLGTRGKRVHQSLVHENGRLIDRIVVEAQEQGRHVFYFDVTKNILDLGAAMAKAAPHIKDAMEAGRNEPCPCGSGKKFKKCCLK